MKNIVRTAIAASAIVLGTFAGLGSAPAGAAAPVSASPAVDCSRSGAIRPTVYMAVNSPVAGPVSEWVAVRARFYRWTGGQWSYAGATGWAVQKAPSTVDFGSLGAADGYYYVGFDSYTWDGSKWVDGRSTWATSYTVWAPGSQASNAYCVVKNLGNTPF